MQLSRGTQPETVWRGQEDIINVVGSASGRETRGFHRLKAAFCLGLGRRGSVVAMAFIGGRLAGWRIGMEYGVLDMEYWVRST